MAAEKGGVDGTGMNTPEKRGVRAAPLIGFLLLVAAVVLFLHWYTSYVHQSLTPRVVAGTAPPAFTLPALDGRMVSLADYKGKVVLLNIWATWCPPCREEMPSMEKLYEQLEGEDFEILAVSVDLSGAEAVGPFVKRYGLRFPALLDTDAKVQHLYGTTGIPESFIIGRDGRIRKVIVGPVDWAAPASVRFFRGLLAEPRPG